MSVLQVHISASQLARDVGQKAALSAIMPESDSRPVNDVIEAI